MRKLLSIITLVALLCTPPVRAEAAVQFSEGVLKSYTVGTNVTASLDITATGTNRVAFVWVYNTLVGGTNATSVTIGTASGTYTGLSGPGSPGNFGVFYLWQVIAPPPGTQTVTVSGPSATYAFIASNYSGVNQTTPINASATKSSTGNGGTVNVTSNVAGTLAAGAVNEGAGTPVATAPTVDRFVSGSAYGQFDNAAASSTAGTDVINVGSFGGSSPYDFIAIQIAPPTAAATEDTSLVPVPISGGIADSSGGMGI